MATLITTVMIIGLSIVIFAAGIAIFIWASTLSSKMRPYHLDDQEGTITPGKASAWFTVIAGALMASGGIAGIILGASPDKYFLSVPLITMGGRNSGLHGTLFDPYARPQMEFFLCRRSVNNIWRHVRQPTHKDLLGRHHSNRLYIFRILVHPIRK